MLRSRDLLSSFTTSLTHMLQPASNSPRSPHSPLPAAAASPPSFTSAAQPSSAAASLSSSSVGSFVALQQPVQFHISPHHGTSSSQLFASSASASSSPFFSPPRSERASGASSPRRFRSPQSSKKRMSRSLSTSSTRHTDVASVTSLNYSNLYSPPHNLYSHLYSHSSSSSTSSSTASSLSFHPARTHPSSSFLLAFTASLHTSPDSTSHDLSAPPSPTSTSRSRTLAISVGGLASANLLPAYRTLQPLEAFPTPVRAPPSLPPSMPRPALPPQPAYPPSFVQVTEEDKDEARTPTADIDEHDPELASLSSSSSFSLSRQLPSTPTLSRFRPARTPSISSHMVLPVARDDFAYVELDPREPLPVWHPSMRSSYSI